MRVLDSDGVGEHARGDVASLFANPALDLQQVGAIAVDMVMAASALADVFRPAPLLELCRYFHGPGTVDRLDVPLLHQALRESVVTAAPMERVLTAVRRACLESVERCEGWSEGHRRVVLSIAAQSFNCEYAYRVSEEERSRLDALRPEAESVVSEGRCDADSLIRALAWAMYEPLCDLGSPADLLRWSGSVVDPTVVHVLRRQIDDRLEEQGLRARLEHFGAPAADPVRDQYESSPYPRWMHLAASPGPTFADAMYERFPSIGWPPRGRRIRALVAGCGTGHEALSMAVRHPDVDVTAVDFSTSSLAYAVQQARRRGITGVRFLHGDIMDVGILGMEFDFVQSIGVLHHMRDPEAALRVLTGALIPRGCLRLGLYSRRMRERLQPLRERFKGRALHASSPATLRAARAEAADALGDGVGPGTRDFHYLSGFRDLMCHAREVHFTPIELRGVLARHRLTFLGYDRISDADRTKYRARVPEDPDMRDLAAIDGFEEEHPGLFQGLQIFWVQRD